jgi:hypothetical protein
MQAAVKTVLVSHFVSPLQQTPKLTRYTLDRHALWTYLHNLQLHLGGFRLRQINSSLVPPTVWFCCRMSAVCAALKVLLPLHVKAPKLPHRKKCCPSLIPFHINWTFYNVQSLLFHHTEFQNDTDKWTIIGRFVKCGCQTWYLTLWKEGRLRVFQGGEGVRRLEKNCILRSVKILVFAKHSSLKITSVCYMWERGDRLRTGLWWETSRTEVTGKTMPRWDDNIKVDVKAVACGFSWMRIETRGGLLWIWRLT